MTWRDLFWYNTATVQEIVWVALALIGTIIAGRAWSQGVRLRRRLPATADTLLREAGRRIYRDRIRCLLHGLTLLVGLLAIVTEPTGPPTFYRIAATSLFLIFAFFLLDLTLYDRRQWLDDLARLLREAETQTAQADLGAQFAEVKAIGREAIARADAAYVAANDVNAKIDRVTGQDITLDRIDETGTDTNARVRNVEDRIGAVEREQEGE